MRVFLFNVDPADPIKRYPNPYFFLFQTGSNEDGGIHITNNNSTSGIFERVLAGEIPNVKMYGAKGNSTLDDTKAIQSALSNVPLKAGNHLLFPSGHYYITNTLVFLDCMHIEGEGPQFGTFIHMMPGTNNVAFLDIFRTRSADVAQHGNLSISGNYYTNSYGICDMAHGLIFENMWTLFGDSPNNQAWTSGDQKGAGLCMFEAGEATIIRNVQMWGGGYGIRCIGGGTPGLRVENSTFFYNAIAGICVEPIVYNGGVDSGTGPMTFTGVSGDLMHIAQETNACLILISNVWPNATITDISAEGMYGGGVVRLVSPPNLGGVPYGTVKINGGSVRLGGGNLPGYDFVVITNPFEDTTRHSPIVIMEPGAHYGVRYMIRDEFGQRNVVSPPMGITQVPIHRQFEYESYAIWGTERQSRVVYGDTTYQSFTPTTNGWWRVTLPLNAIGLSGGKITINSLFDSTSFEFNGSAGNDMWINTNSVRRTKSTHWNNSTPLVTKVRGVNYWETSIGGVSGVNGSRNAIELYVEKPFQYQDGSYETINLTMPIESRYQAGPEAVDLINPILLNDQGPSSNYRTNANETYSLSTGPIVLTRP